MSNSSDPVVHALPEPTAWGVSPLPALMAEWQRRQLESFMLRELGPPSYSLLLESAKQSQEAFRRWRVG